MKWISVAVSAVLGVGLAAVAAWGVVTSNTAAPSHNPAGDSKQQTAPYGDNK